jgi:DNA-binding protein YbaB
MALPNFGKMKELYELKKKADSLKKEMEKIVTVEEYRGVTISMRGDQHIEEIIVDGEKDDRLEEAFNKALKESQKEVAKKMQGRLGDLGLGL